MLFLSALAMSINLAATTQKELLNQINSETAVLIDAETGQVLFAKAMNKKMFPASITKVMTGLLALEKGKLDDHITMSEEAVFSIGRGTSHIALDVDEQITLEQALYALAIESANDAANGIAENIGGSLTGFAELMNKRAQELGAFNTNFVNAHGLPDEQHYTTAYDMALITMEAAKIPEFRKIFSTLDYEISPTNKQKEVRYFHSTNSMLRGESSYQGIVAAKVGWTKAAQHTRITVAKRDNRTLIAVVMKSISKNDSCEDTTKLLDFGFNEFKRVTFTEELVDKSDVVLSDRAGNSYRADFIANQPQNFLLHQQITASQVELNYQLPTKLVQGETTSGKALLSLPTELAEFMYVSIGAISLQAKDEKGVAIGSVNNEEVKSWQETAGALGSGLFKTLLFLLVLGLAIRYYNVRKRRMRRQKRLARQKLEAKMLERK